MWGPMVRITAAAQRDIYEHAYLQQRQIINRLKTERESTLQMLLIGLIIGGGWLRMSA